MAAAEGGATTAGCVVAVGAFSAEGGTVATVGTAAGCRDAVVDGENTGGATGAGLGAITTTGWAAGWGCASGLCVAGSGSVAWGEAVLSRNTMFARRESGCVGAVEEVITRRNCGNTLAQQYSRRKIIE